MKLTIEIKELTRQTFQRLADRSGESLKEYVAAVLDSSAKEIERSHESDPMDQALLDREEKND